MGMSLQKDLLRRVQSHNGTNRPKKECVWGGTYLPQVQQVETINIADRSKNFA